jgi:RES domain-containing protein
MIVYRFSAPKFANDISGTGAKLKGGRWNIPGIPVLYTSASISLALLETLVNAATLDELLSIQLVEIEIEEINFHEINPDQLKKDWWTDFDYTQWMGSEILKNNNNILAIKCPSAVVDGEYNFIINPYSSSFKTIKVNSRKSFRFDKRLFKTSKKEA